MEDIDCGILMSTRKGLLYNLEKYGPKLFIALFILVLTFNLLLPHIVIPNKTNVLCTKTNLAGYIFTCDSQTGGCSDAPFYQGFRSRNLRYVFITAMFAIVFTFIIPWLIRYKEGSENKQSLYVPILASLLVISLILFLTYFDAKCFEVQYPPPKNYEDAGMQCTDSSQCLGVCVYAGTENEIHHGKCSKEDPIIENLWCDQLDLCSFYWYEVVHGTLVERFSYGKFE